MWYNSQCWHGSFCKSTQSKSSMAFYIVLEMITISASQHIFRLKESCFHHAVPTVNTPWIKHFNRGAQIGEKAAVGNFSKSSKYAK